MSFDLVNSLFALLIVAILAGTVVLYALDVMQNEDAIRRNYPVIGRFRGLFTTLGEFFRQYFFAMDREELPFNRAERDWVDHASDGGKSTVAFGSTKQMSAVGNAIFVNASFPPLAHEFEAAHPTVIGPDADQPFHPRSLFNISGMSYGALSAPAIEALSRGAAKAGCWLNTGEGALAPMHEAADADLVFQIGTAKYGVQGDGATMDWDKLRTLAANPRIKMFELKLAQGAKPGKGGILPARKINEDIAQVRGIPMGQASISPSRQTDIANHSELHAMIARMKAVTGKPVGIKIVVSSTELIDGLSQSAAALGTEGLPDFITVDGGDGGTGASPMPLMDNVGLPLREALVLAVDALNRHGLRERIRVIASGKLVTPSGVALALATGADFVVSARGFMFALGCIQAMKCNKNTCPTGITTHNPRLQEGLDPTDKAERVAQYVASVNEDVATIAHSCGVPNPQDLARKHVRIVQPDGTSRSFADLYSAGSFN